MNHYKIIYENNNGSIEEGYYDSDNILGAIGCFLEIGIAPIEQILTVNLES